MCVEPRRSKRYILGSVIIVVERVNIAYACVGGNFMMLCSLFSIKAAR